MFVIIIIIKADVAGMRVSVRGPFDSEAEAERERRNIHMDYVINDEWNKPVTLVKRVEAP